MNVCPTVLPVEPVGSIRTDQRRGGNPAVGSAIVSVFGTCWLVLGSAGIYSSLILAAIIVCGVTLLVASVATIRATSAFVLDETAAEKAHRERVFRNANIAQWVAVPVLVILLNVVGMTQWITPGIILIVGLHFIPLATIFGRKQLLTAAAIFISLAVIGPWVVADGPASNILPIVAGLTLWVYALVGLKNAMALND